MMTIKAIARIVPINGNSWSEFYAATVNESSDAWEGIKDDGKGYHCYKRHWKVEMSPVEWDGEGLPPVGTECELRHHSKDEWHTVKITGFGEEGVVLRMPNVSNELYLRVDGRQFRPIRSARDKAVEAMIEWKDAPTRINETYYHAVYDAIAAGKIPGIKLDN